MNAEGVCRLVQARGHGVWVPAFAGTTRSGLRTADIKSEGTTTAVSTTQMGEAILKELQALHG